MTATIPAENLQAALDHEERAEDFLDAERYQDAIVEADAALSLGSNSIQAWLVRAAALKALGRLGEAAAALEAVLAFVPGLADVRVNVANLYAALEQFSKAESHLVEAIALQPMLIEAYASLGSVYIRMVRYDLAEAPTRHALSLDSRNIVANQNLAAILARQGAPDAKIYRDIAFGREQIVVERAQVTGAPVALILSSPGSGNVPYQYLLPRTHYGRILWYLEYAPPGQAEQLPPHDFIFNAIGDPDAAPEAQHAVEDFAPHCRRPLVNRPDRVARTFRSTLPALLAQIPGVVVPGAMRFLRADGHLASAILASPLRFPLIVRPAGRHGGEGAVRIDAPAELAAHSPDAEAVYATEFVDCRGADGWYRKYRAIFVDRKPYPYHLAIGDHWLLHYWTAGMDKDATRRSEEAAFLADPQAAIGKRAWAALKAIAATLDLDYAGIDFSLLPDGRLLFFEANATMLVHPEEDAMFDYKNGAVRAIIEAFATMIEQRLPQ